MNITIYIDKNGKVIISDFPEDLIPLVMELKGKSSTHYCDAISGFSLNDLINK